MFIPDFTFYLCTRASGGVNFRTFTPSSPHGVLLHQGHFRTFALFPRFKSWADINSGSHLEPSMRGSRVRLLIISELHLKKNVKNTLFFLRNCSIRAGTCLYSA